MKQAILLLVLIAVASLIVWQRQVTKKPNIPESSVVQTPQATEVITENLEIPWEVALLPNAELLVTERPGKLLKIGKDRQTIPIEGVQHVGEGGLLGLALHPNFKDNQLIYVYLTTKAGEGLSNRVERYRLEGTKLADRKPIIENIPGASFHDGGRLAFGPDQKLYITTGDAGKKPLAQNKNSLAGKILRVNGDGSIPNDNPFGNAVWSYGHRNVQGIAWDNKGRMWATEHGARAHDELNRIERGGNYGWPEIEGDEQRSGMVSPVIQSGTDTWAPSGLAFLDNKLYFSGLAGQALFVVSVNEDGSLSELETHLKDKFGRLRAVQPGLDGKLYLTTSNTDGRGQPQQGDDKIIKVDPSSLK